MSIRQYLSLCGQAMLAVLGLSVLALIGLTPLLWTLNVASFPAFLFVEGGLTAPVPWLAAIVLVPIYAVVGYVTASRAGEHGILAAVVPAAAIWALLLIGFAAGNRLRWAALAGPVLFLPLGAALKVYGRPSRSGPSFGEVGRMLYPYILFPFGLIVTLGVHLAFLYTPKVTKDSTGLAENIPSYVLMALLLIPAVPALAYGTYRLVQGWRRERKKSPLAYVLATLAVAGLFAYGFVSRHHANHVEEPERDEPDVAVRQAGNKSAQQFLRAARRTADLSRRKEPPHTPWKPPDNPELADWLKRNEGAIELALEAAEGENIRFTAPVSYQELRRLSSPLRQKALLLFGQGKAGEAMRHLAAARHMWRAVSRGAERPYLVHIEATQRWTLETAYAGLRHLHDSPEKLRDILQVVRTWVEADTLPLRRLKNAVRAEWRREAATPFFKKRHSGFLPYLGTQMVSRPYLRQLERSMLEKYLEPQSYRALLKSVSSRLEKQHGRLCRGPEWMHGPFSGLASKAVRCTVAQNLLWCDTPVELLMEYRTRKRVLAAFAGALLYRAEKGQFPGSAEELVPEYLSSAPRDPYADRALNWRLTDNGLEIWSVGGNMKDDGGQGWFSDTFAPPSSPGRTTFGPDVFQVPQHSKDIVARFPPDQDSQSTNSKGPAQRFRP